MQTLSKLMQAMDWEVLMVTGLRVLLILFIAWVLGRLIKLALRRMERRLMLRGKAVGEVPSESAKRAETLVRLLRQGAQSMLWLVATLIVLREMHIDIAPILASAGIAGIALGFGAQNLVRDVISGFFMIMENQVRVGDVAIVNGTGGLVEQLNFRTLVLRDLSGIVHIFPNGSINTLSNVTQEWSAYVFDISVDYSADTDQVMDVMREVGRQLRADGQFGPLMVDDVEIFGVDNFTDSAVVIKGRLRTKPIKQWDVGREYRRRLKKAFEAAGIRIPFPQRSLHFADKSKPLDVLVTEMRANRA